MDLTSNDGRTDDPNVRDGIKELVWRFHTAESAIGIRAQNMSDIQCGTVFDENASHDAHMKLRGERHRWSVDRMRAIDATIAAMDCPESARAIRDAFTPGGRVDARVAHQFEVEFSTQFDGASGTQRASILGFALRSRAMRLAWASHHESVVMPDQDELLSLLANASDATLKTIARGALGELAPALERYSEARLVRLEHEAETRRRKADRCRAQADAIIRATHIRLWGSHEPV